MVSAHRTKLAFWFCAIATAFARPADFTLLTDVREFRHKVWWSHSTYGNGSPPPRIIETGVGVSPLKGIASIVTTLLLHGNGF